MNTQPLVKIMSACVSGRVRFKVTGLYRCESLKRYLEVRLSTSDGIKEVSSSILTGTLLVTYSSHQSTHAIALCIETFISEYKKNNGIVTDAAISDRTGAFEEKREKSLDKSKNRRTLRTLVSHAKEQLVKSWHLLTGDSVVKDLQGSQAQGLSTAEAYIRYKKYGPNLLPEAVPHSGFKIFIDQFMSLPVGLLSGAAFLSALTGGVADAIAIMSVVTINAIIGYVTESQSEKTIHSLKSVVRPSALVLRDGQVQEIKSEDVVIGDIFILRPGSYVAADSRLLHVQNLSIDESALTGESMPVVKTSQSLSLKDTPLADRVNMVYMGTLVTGGQGVAIVVATGGYTEMGMIQTLVGEVKPPDTPMERQLTKIGNSLVYICSGVCGLVFIVGLLRGYGFIQMFKIAISLAVAAVPEGLPALATTILAFGIRQMKRHNVLIRHLEAVETLGSVQTICLDKTGTLTMNKMTVMAVYTGEKHLIRKNGYLVNDNSPVHLYDSEELALLFQVCVLCNESEISSEEDEYLLNGSSTENALIHMALSLEMDVIKLRRHNPMLHIEHRSERRNYMVTYHGQGNGEKFVAVKGSPDEVLRMCQYHMINDEKITLTDDDRRRIEIENEKMAGQALRILGVAYTTVGKDEQWTGDEGELIWLGLVGMADPIRGGVQGLVSLFHRAGIDTVMITGDQSSTAYAIGKQLNLSNDEGLEILDSGHLIDLEPDVLKALAGKVHVFSRVSPAHKLQIVQALQNANKVIAMTGDGINDAPALKAADIGIAMGHTGTDVAREVADVVLEDDNLETMIIAVSQGRTIYNNIRKSIHYLLSTNLTEIMVSFATIAAGIGHPLNTMQLLWINLMSDIWPGLALSFEPPEPDVLNQPPRDPDEPIITTEGLKRMTQESAVISAGALSAYGYGILRYGVSPQATTMMFTSLTIGQLIHALSCRSEDTTIFDNVKMLPNKQLTYALGASLALQGLSMFVPGLRNLLSITPINLIDGLIIGSGATIPLIINEITKKKKRDKNDEKRLHDNI